MPYATPAQRIGKWKGEILSRAIPVEVLQIAGVHKAMPKNASDTVVYRRWVPYNADKTTGVSNGVIPTSTNGSRLIADRTTNETGPDSTDSNIVATMLAGGAAASLLTEGTTPTADTLVAQDVTVTLKQYGCLYDFTDKQADLGEDDIEDALKTQVAERIALIRELELYAKVRAATNRFFSGSGATTVATVNSGLTASLLRKVARSLANNHAKKQTSILAPSANVGTKPIEAAYLVFCHTDLEADLRNTTNFPGYTPVAEYGSRKPLHENEIGSFESFRFIASPELVPYANAGGAAATYTTMETSGGTGINVYPVIVTGQEAYGTVALRGANAFDLSVIPVGTKDKSDPLGQRGYVGAKFYASSAVLNQQWMAVIYCGAAKL